MTPDGAEVPRKQLSPAWVTEEARDGWHDFCDNHGCGSLAALIEASGMFLAERADTPTHELEPLLQQLVADARRIHKERRPR